MIIKSIVTTTLISSLFLANASLAAGNKGNNGSTSRTTTATELTSTETSDLQFMREEEKLARDVYLTLDQHWGNQTQVFANISVSEESHTSTVDYLLDKFGVENPVVNDTIGVFINPELQALYNKLIAQGQLSFVDGLYVGALIEEKDMRDILTAISQTDERAIILAYSNLLDGSKNHLQAFVNVIEAQGLGYEAQILDAEEVTLILDDNSK